MILCIARPIGWKDDTGVSGPYSWIESFEWGLSNTHVTQQLSDDGRDSDVRVSEEEELCGEEWLAMDFLGGMNERARVTHGSLL
jgi:hypothetical protein